VTRAILLQGRPFERDKFTLSLRDQKSQVLYFADMHSVARRK